VPLCYRENVIVISLVILFFVSC